MKSTKKRTVKAQSKFTYCYIKDATISMRSWLFETQQVVHYIMFSLRLVPCTTKCTKVHRENHKMYVKSCISRESAKYMVLCKHNIIMFEIYVDILSKDFCPGSILCTFLCWWVQILRFGLFVFQFIEVNIMS